LQPAFFAYLASTASNVTGDNTGYRIGSTVALTKVYDIGNNLNTNGTFTAPVAGIYHFIFAANLSNITTQTNLAVFATISGQTYYVNSTQPANCKQSAGLIFQGTLYANMSAGDTAVFIYSVDGGPKTVNATGAANYQTYIQGRLVG
jgi:hypothetical protein